MKPTFVVIAVLAPFASALPQAFGVPSFITPSKPKGHDASSNSIELAEMGLNQAGTSNQKPSGKLDSTPGDNPNGKVGGIFGGSPGGSSSAAAPSAAASSSAVFGGVSDRVWGTVRGSLNKLPGVGPSAQDQRDAHMKFLDEEREMAIAAEERAEDNMARELITHTRLAAIEARSMTEKRLELVHEYFKASDPETVRKVIKLFDDMIVLLGTQSPIKYTRKDKDYLCTKRGQELPGYTLVDKRKVVLCQRLYSPERPQRIRIYLGKESYSYIPMESARCGTKSRITVLMHLLRLPRGDPKPTFLIYEELMGLNTAQALENPGSLAMFAQALRWEKAHGYGSCSGLAKQQYPGRKTFTPEIAITPPPSTHLPGYMKETLSDAISRKQAKQQPAQGPSADRLAPPPVRIPTEGRPPVAQGKGKGKGKSE